MSDLRFDTPDNEFGRPPEKEQGTDITGKFVEWGLASDRQQASYILMILGAIAIGIALFFLLRGGGDVPPPPPVSN